MQISQNRRKIMDHIPFNSRNTLHKSKFGAVRQGENFVFRVVLPRSINCTGVTLAIKKDGEDYKYIPFSFCYFLQEIAALVK